MKARANTSSTARPVRASASHVSSATSTMLEASSVPQETMFFEDKRPETLIQRKRQEMVENSPQIVAQRRVQARATAQGQAPIQLGKKKKKPPISNKERKKRQAQSNRDRGVNRLGGYSRDQLKYMEKTMTTKEIKDASSGMKGHLSRKGGKASPMTQKALKEVAKKSSVTKKMTKEEKKAARMLKKKQEWLAKQDLEQRLRRRDDENDQGGAGGGFGILVN